MNSESTIIGSSIGPHASAASGRAGPVLPRWRGISVTWAPVRYTPLQTVVQATGGRFTPQSALGILSSIIWTLIITISSSTACS